MNRLLALSLVVSALLGCEQLLPRGFPHRAHLTQERCGGPGQMDCPTCTSCHAAKRQDGAEPPLSEKICSGCHQQDARAMMAQVRPSSQKRTDIVYSHKEHLVLPGLAGTCVSCHRGVASDGERGAMFPPMSTCLSCHQDGLQQDRCTSCHQRRELRALVPETFLRHDATFFRNHGMAAAQHEGVCNQCHAESECARCHDQSQPLGLADIFPEAVNRPFIHRADFVVRHAIEARSERGTCARCHQPSFCDACHVERGVSGNRVGSINPHPLGWVGPDTTSRNFHGRAARRDIVSCAGCHDAGPATNCIRCHKVGGPGGNPHPSGWGSSRSRDSQMCRYCHDG